MANASVYKELGGFIGSAPNHAVLEYDFANDTGAIATYTLASAKQKLVIKSAYVHVVTTCTSAGSATVAVGTTDDADGILDITSGAVASLTADAVLFEDASEGLFMDVGDALNLAIATAALTAGKIHVHIDYDILDS